MDPRRVLLLRDVVRAGSISAAARSRGWTQPALSQQLQALEREAGSALLLRGPRGVEPTEAGRVLLVRAETVAAALHMAEEELAALVDLRSGRVRLAAYPSALATLVPRALARLRRQHPGLVIELEEAEPREALALLAAGDVDLALVFGYDDPPAPTRTPVEPSRILLGREPVHLVLPPGHPLAAHPQLAPRDLATQTWVAGCRHCREHLVAMASRAGFEPEIRHTTDDYVVVQHLVVAGLGVALLPQSALTAYRHPEIVVREGPRWGSRWFGAAHRDGAQTVPATAALLTELARVAARGEPEERAAVQRRAIPGDRI